MRSRLQSTRRPGSGPGTAPGPSRPHAEGYTRDHIRRGTTTLFAASDIATGSLIARCSIRHRRREWLSFPRLIDRETTSELEVHFVCDNYSTHKHSKVRPRHANKQRFHLYHAPTYAS